jgi:hypothetical protein
MGISYGPAQAGSLRAARWSRCRCGSSAMMILVRGGRIWIRCLACGHLWEAGMPEWQPIPPRVSLRQAVVSQPFPERRISPGI